jgi:hypothetical protein
VFAPEKLVDEAVKTASKIASMSQPMVQMAKEAVNQCKWFDGAIVVLTRLIAFELSLSSGLLFERRLFHSTFATASDYNIPYNTTTNQPANPTDGPNGRHGCLCGEKKAKVY